MNTTLQLSNKIADVEKQIQSIKSQLGNKPLHKEVHLLDQLEDLEEKLELLLSDYEIEKYLSEFEDESEITERRKVIKGLSGK